MSDENHSETPPPSNSLRSFPSRWMHDRIKEILHNALVRAGWRPKDSLAKDYILIRRTKKDPPTESQK